MKINSPRAEREMRRRMKTTLQILSATSRRTWMKINRYLNPQEGKRGEMSPPERFRQAPQTEMPNGFIPFRWTTTMLDSFSTVDRQIMAAEIMGVDNTDVFSPERVTQVAHRFGPVAGTSFDLLNG